MTLTAALVVAWPAGLLAVHVYVPACCAPTRLIFRQHVPLICVTAYSVADVTGSMTSPPRCHDTAGGGAPVT